MVWYARTHLKPGMKVAAPVFGRGRLLVSSGTEVDQRLISKLQTWGIDHLPVENPTDGAKDSRSAH